MGTKINLGNKTSLMYTDDIKFHKILLDNIAGFNESKSGKLISKNKNFDGKTAKFRSSKKEFTIEFDTDIFSKNYDRIDVGEYLDGIQIQFGETIYNLESVFLRNYSQPRFTGTIDRINSEGFSEANEYYYQLIIPLKKELDFHFNIQQTIFTTDLGYKSRTGTIATISGEPIQACCICNENKDYFLAIDSKRKQSYEEFAEKAHSIKIGIGYLSGHCAGDRGYFFAYSDSNKEQPEHFRTVGLRDSILSSYRPIYSNAYGYLHGDQDLADKYYPLLRPVSLKEFSKLCNKIHDSLDFSSTLMLILESSIASLLFMPGGFAIALETLSDLVIDNKKLKLAPIKDKSVSRKIRKEILAVLDENDESIEPDDLETLKKRIDQLNQTTNKARLKAPFDLLGIGINEKDLEILETRNDFLHGRVPDITKSGRLRSTERINKDLYYCSLRFYTLLNLIILKWIGFDNRVVNYPKINEGFTEYMLDEEPFRQV